MDQSQLT